MTIPVQDIKGSTTIIISHKEAAQQEFPFPEISRCLVPKPKTLRDIGALIVAVVRCAKAHPDKMFELSEDMLYLYSRFGTQTGEPLVDHWSAMSVPDNVVLPKKYRVRRQHEELFSGSPDQLDLFPA